VKPEDLMGLQGFKEGQRDKHLRSTLLDYCGVKETRVQRLEINYDRTRHGGVNISRLKKVISRYGDGASVCTGIAYLVREQVFEKHRGPVVAIWEPFTIHSDSPETKDSMFIRELREINREETGKHGFKLGTLDLVKIAPARQWSLSRRSYIDATSLESARIGGKVLSPKDRVCNLQEPLDTELKSRRLYRMGSAKAWELVGW